MSSPKHIDVMNYWSAKGGKSLLENLELFRDKASTILQGTALVPYPAHTVIRSHSAKYLPWIKGNGHTVVGFLLAKVGSDLKDIFIMSIKGSGLCTCLQTQVRFMTMKRGNSPQRWTDSRRICLHCMPLYWRR